MQQLLAMFPFAKRRKKPVFIEEIATEDLCQLAEIHRQSFAAPWSDGELQKMLSNPLYIGLLARRVGGGAQPPLGFVLIRVAADEAEIITIAVSTRHRHRGIATALMNASIRRLQEDRIKTVFLEVDSANQNAIRLYTQLGFITVSDRVGYYRRTDEETGKRSNALVMRLELG